MLDLRDASAAPDDLTRLRARLDRVVEGLAATLDELRETSRGIHPAVLSEGGLPPAIEALARRPAVPVELTVDLGCRLPEQVEVAAYYVVSEALANAAKHARASATQVARADRRRQPAPVRPRRRRSAAPASGRAPG